MALSTSRLLWTSISQTPLGKSGSCSLSRNYFPVGYFQFLVLSYSVLSESVHSEVFMNITVTSLGDILVSGLSRSKNRSALKPYCQLPGVVAWIENGPHRFLYLNVWATSGRTVWERLGSAVFLEKCLLGEMSRFSMPLPVTFSLSLPCACGSDVSSQLLL